MMVCPSRTDHYSPPVVNSWDMYMANSKWNNFWSTYHGIGLSCWVFTHLPDGSHPFWYYSARLDKHDPEQPLLTDMVVPNEPNLGWHFLKQTNHWRQGAVHGGNVAYADGHIGWISYDYSPGTWRTDTTSGAYMPSGSAVFLWNAWGKNETYWLSGSGVKGAVRGKMHTY
jgi:prepilin-type processing-associated H-X9-DG protein